MLIAAIATKAKMNVLNTRTFAFMVSYCLRTLTRELDFSMSYCGCKYQTSVGPLTLCGQIYIVFVVCNLDAKSLYFTHCAIIAEIIATGGSDMYKA